MTSYQQMIEMEEEYMMTGDARKCPHHPHVKTSSDDGMHDAPCGECELLMDIAAEESRTDLDRARERVNIHRPELEFESEAYEAALAQELVQLDLDRQEYANRQREREELERSYREEEDDIPF